MHAHLRPVLVKRLLAALLILTAALFLPAGTLRYWEAWVFLGVLFVPVP